MATRMQAYRLAYDGTVYRGFQRQPDVQTVEGVLFDALRTLSILEGSAAKPDGYAAAGRTDAGVSAVAQTISFRAPEWCSAAAVNSELPASVRAWATADVSEEFHARVDATSREYRYHLYAPGASEGRARKALDRFVGIHDYHNLTPHDGRTTRELFEAGARRDGEFLVLSVRADSFVRELVRRLVTVVERVATGVEEPEYVDRVLSDERLVGPDGIEPAPAEPLLLTDVAYPDVEFSVDEEAAESARTVFEKRRVEQLTGARIAEDVRDWL